MHRQTITITVDISPAGMRHAEQDAAKGEKGAIKHTGLKPLPPEGRTRLVRALLAARAMQSVESIMPDLLAATHMQSSEYDAPMTVRIDTKDEYGRPTGATVSIDISPIQPTVITA